MHFTVKKLGRNFAVKRLDTAWPIGYGTHLERRALSSIGRATGS